MQENKDKENRSVLIEARGIEKEFRIGRGQSVHALSGIDLKIYEGETLALVGESGCGKSTFGRILIHMLAPTGGEVLYRGENISSLKDRQFKPYRRKMQMVFQDPYSSLDPRMTVRDIIAEPLVTYKEFPNAASTTQEVLRLMKKVGISGDLLHRYPHQFSGGQRQRIGIARAIALSPELLVCDEPVSALDVSVQSQVLNLLKHLKMEMNLTSLFISHDLSVIDFIADRVCVMFLGRLCEVADKEELYSRPLHPYTAFLLDAIPLPDPHRRDENRKILTGEVPSPVNPPSGCFFRTRCPFAGDRCAEEVPLMKDYGREGKSHLAACHRCEENHRKTMDKLQRNHG